MNAENKKGDMDPELNDFLSDLDLLGHGVNKYQKPSNVMRRAIVSAVRKGREKGL